LPVKFNKSQLNKIVNQLLVHHRMTKTNCYNFTFKCSGLVHTTWAQTSNMLHESPQRRWQQQWSTTNSSQNRQIPTK